MSPEEDRQELLRFGGEERRFTITRPPARGGRRIESLGAERRRAQAEASDAYRRWDACRSPEAYAAYRAAQDRADAAQDELARAAARSR